VQYRDRYNKLNSSEPRSLLGFAVFLFVLSIGQMIKSARNQKLSKNDVIFLARTSERTNLVKGKLYNIHADSFSDCLGDKYSIQHLEFSDDGKVPSSQFRASYHLDFHLFINRIKFKLIKHFLL